MQSDPKVLKVMGKNPWRTSSQVNWYQFVKNIQNMASWDWYKDSHKQDMLMWQESKKTKIYGVVTPKYFAIRHIVRIVNLTHFALPSDYEVKNATVRKYVDLGKASESPENRGWQPIIADALLEESNLHVTGMQASVDIGESDKSIMIATIDAMF